MEAGLGGRYDATSVIDSRVQVLTNVGLEHTRWLGPTERHIAEEKLAVVPAGRDARGRAARRRRRSRSPTRIAARAGRGAAPVRDATSRSTAGERPFTVETPGGAYGGIVLRPLGRFQRTNFALAVAAAEAFLGRALDPDAVRRGCARAGAARAARGRRRSDPLVVLDGAHNPSGARRSRSRFRAVVGERRG